MKISQSWLNTYLDRPVDAEQVEQLLTDQGFPIEQRLVNEVDPGDVILDVEVTSNRSDCLSHVGVAREIAAGSERTVVEPPCTSLVNGSGDPEANPAEESVPPPVIRNEVESLCPLYTARLIRGVKVGPSPDWLRHRIESIGLRSVNNVVDVTNFVLHELGQPLHAFDLARLSGGTIVVRMATQGERFIAIDGSKHDLRDDTLVVADADNPVAVAGVMGGAESEVTETTTDLLLESAIFDPLSVRRTSRALKLGSDSSYRFERGVDPLGVERASHRAANLIRDLAGGTLGEVIRVGCPVPTPRTIEMRVQRCERLLGIELGPQRIVGLLGRLGLDPGLKEDPQRVICTVPTYRLDLEREIDLVEEVARLHGFDAIPVTEKIHIVSNPMGSNIAARRQIDRVLTAHGYHETITFSFVSMKHGTPFLSRGQHPLLVDDERRKPEPMLRPSILPSLLGCRKTNQDVGNSAVRLFETAGTWTRNDADQTIERRALTLLADAPDPQQSLHSLRGTIEELVEHLAAGRDPITFVPSPSEVFSVAARVRVQDRDIGWMGLIRPEIEKLFDLQTPVVGAELDVTGLLDAYPPDREVGPLPRFPGIERDLSIIVSEKIRWEQIERIVRDVDPDRLENLQFLGAYRGKPIPKGDKSVALRLNFRDPTTTLRREQVDDQIQILMDRFSQELNARLRQ